METGEKNIMARNKSFGIVTILALMLITLCSTVVSAQTKLEGVIKGRSGSEIILQTADAPNLIVQLSATCVITSSASCGM
jgi:hypothetical protein